jgi:energy-coupling factor transporter ATP-binding protein EcfA2
MTTKAIHVQGIEKSYKELRVLRGVDFGVAPGSIFALLGSNGAGKTTVVRILSTLLKSDAGTATAEIQHGCDQIVRTFTVTAPGGAASAATASTAAAPRPGKKIVFTSNRTGAYNLYLVNADGSGLRQLTRFQIGDVARPSLSPDGTTIVFQRQDKPAATWDIWGRAGRRLQDAQPHPRTRRRGRDHLVTGRHQGRLRQQPKQRLRHLPHEP